MSWYGRYVMAGGSAMNPEHLSSFVQAWPLPLVEAVTMTALACFFPFALAAMWFLYWHWFLR